MIGYSCIIPARMDSSRFFGKPLKEVLGRPMVITVADNCASFLGKHNVFVATPDIEIADCCKTYGYSYIMTSDKCATGADRVAEASFDVRGRYIISVQGDEPLVQADDLKAAIAVHECHQDDVVNCMAITNNEIDIKSKNVIKMACNEKNHLLYASRSPIPADKDGNTFAAFKQVCISVYRKEILQRLYGKGKEKSHIEKIEDIDILRFLENGVRVRMAIVANNKHAVDEPRDIITVNAIGNYNG